MANFVNLCPHQIVLNDGRVFPPSGSIARVSSAFSEFDSDGVCSNVFGEITGLPAPQHDTIYIVSMLVAGLVKRADVVSPATGHPACVRESGQVKSVPGFVRG